MTQPKPKEKFVFTHPKDEDGNDILFRFMLTLDRKISSLGKTLPDSIGTIDGIDAVVPQVGMYTMEIAIARTFDPAEVIEEIKRRLKDVLSDIIRPNKELIV
mgnify:CR=1 FL=1|jgi:hypothetical protein